jgi:phosphocarrier protein FPr
MDLGSAVLSAELALDLIDDPEVRERVVLSAAPLIEGLIVAAVAAAGEPAARKSPPKPTAHLWAKTLN